MLTVFGKKVASVLRGSNCPIPPTTINSTSKAYIEAKTIAGTTKYINPYSDISYVFASSIPSESSSPCVVVGSGNTPASENDYCLESVISGLSANTPSVVMAFDDENHKYIARLDYTIQNDTGNTVTINEIGLYVRFYLSDTQGGTPVSGTQNRRLFMMDRTVLNTPVVIQDGDAAIVRYEFAY